MGRHIFSGGARLASVDVFAQCAHHPSAQHPVVQETSKGSKMLMERGSAAQGGIHFSSSNCCQKIVCGLISATASGFH